MTFKPKIKNMITEAAIKKEHLNDSQLRALTPEVTIPSDTKQSRLLFKSVPGMNKFLEKQYKAMVKREEQKLLEYNLGKMKSQRLTLEQFTKLDYAYDEKNQKQLNDNQFQSESQGQEASVSYDNYRSRSQKTIENYDLQEIDDPKYYYEEA